MQAWLEEMALYVKSLDTNHMLEVGLEGFYSSAVSLESVDRESSNPGTFATQYGVDFIRNQQISALDFASVHSYPDNWYAPPLSSLHHVQRPHAFFKTVQVIEGKDWGAGLLH